MGIMSGRLPLEGGGLTATRNSGGMVSLGKAREQEGTHRFVLQWEGWRDGVLPVLPASGRVDLRDLNRTAAACCDSCQRFVPIITLLFLA